MCALVKHFLRERRYDIESILWVFGIGSDDEKDFRTK